jgi:hypothetical protein
MPAWSVTRTQTIIDYTKRRKCSKEKRINIQITLITYKIETENEKKGTKYETVFMTRLYWPA